MRYLLITIATVLLIACGDTSSTVGIDIMEVSSESNIADNTIVPDDSIPGESPYIDIAYSSETYSSSSTESSSSVDTIPEEPAVMVAYTIIHNSGMSMTLEGKCTSVDKFFADMKMMGVPDTTVDKNGEIPETTLLTLAEYIVDKGNFDTNPHSYTSWKQSDVPIMFSDSSDVYYPIIDSWEITWSYCNE